MGAFLKASLCLVSGSEAVVTGTAGDLGGLETVERYEAMLAELLASGVQPACAAHDLHPDFHSTRAALGLGCRTLAVQHHHAHTLATQWEHGAEGPVLGLSLDGFGLGPGNQSWGGEMLWVDGPDYRRIGHLAPLAQPGGDIAAREPWRMAAAVLHGQGRGGEIAGRFADQPHAALLDQMLDRQVNCPKTSSCGRLFDAACGLLGILPVSDFEGQAPMAMEAMATDPQVMQGGWVLKNGTLDFAPLLTRLDGMDATGGANLFHGTLAAGFAALVLAARDETGLDSVAFGGGCFLNRVFTTALTEVLQNNSVTVLEPRKLSPGDAGLSFGQAIAGALHTERMT
ncbi:MAG: hydrogenase maturation protein HypF [Rhodobacteraceae bacterium]|nr:hydrogenase maturation protein HypF [Paracoccaceae bacterium]